MLAEALRWGSLPKSVFHDPDALDADAPILRDLPPEVELVAVKGEVLRASGSLGSGSRLIGVWEQRASCPPSGDGRCRLPSRSSGPGERRCGSALGACARPEHRRAQPGHSRPFQPESRAGQHGGDLRSADRARFVRGATCGGGRGLTVRSLSPRGRASRCVKPIFVLRWSLCLGSERLGLPDEIVAGCDEVCHVPLQPDGAESLNVAMAATLCLYELSLHKLSNSQ